MMLIIGGGLALAFILYIANSIRVAIRNKIFHEIYLFLYENFDTMKYKIDLAYFDYKPSRLKDISNFFYMSGLSHVRYYKLKDIYNLYSMIRKDIVYIKDVDFDEIKNSKGLYVLGNENILRTKEKERLLFFYENLKTEHILKRCISAYNIKFGSINKLEYKPRKKAEEQITDTLESETTEIISKYI